MNRHQNQRCIILSYACGTFGGVEHHERISADMGCTVQLFGNLRRQMEGKGGVMIELGQYRYGARRSTIRMMSIAARSAVLGWLFLAIYMWTFFIPSVNSAGPGVHSDLERIASELAFLVGFLFFLFFIGSGLWVTQSLGSVASHDASPATTQKLVRPYTRWLRGFTRPPGALWVVGLGIFVCVPLIKLFVIRHVVTGVTGLGVASALSAIMLIHGWLLLRMAAKARADAAADLFDRYRHFDWTAISVSDKERFSRVHGSDWKFPADIRHRAEAEQYRAEAADMRHGLLFASFILAVFVAVFIQPVLPHFL
jgi:hypothetical protein